MSAAATPALLIWMPPATAKEKTVLPLRFTASFALASRVKLTVELLTTASPLFSADKIKVPMLIGQGANDPRVKQAEAEQIVDAIAKHRGSAVYVLYTDEGHGFVRPDNRLDFTARMEKFLADNLGGRYEPMKGDRIAGSTARLRVVGSPLPTHQN